MKVGSRKAGLFIDDIDATVIVTVITVGMMQVAVDEIGRAASPRIASAPQDASAIVICPIHNHHAGLWKSVA